MRALVLLLLALLVVPSALAHIQGARPILQRGQTERIVDLDPDGLQLNVGLNLADDPLRQTVVHEVTPQAGRFRVEHREDGSRTSDRFYAEWQIERILEYRDTNLNGRWDATMDAPIRAWRLTHYQWGVAAIQEVQVADVRANSVVWEANLTSAPDLRLEVVAAGKDFTDEGAIVRPQDLAIYFDILDLPPRDTGDLYAVEIRTRVQGETALSLHLAEETPTALLADAPLRRALFVWGGEAALDGREQRLDATLSEERVENDGNRSALLTLHVPPAEGEMRFVLLSGIEYAVASKRGAPALGVGLSLAALVLAGGLLGNRKS